MEPSAIRYAKPTDVCSIKEIIDRSFPRFFRYFALHSVSDQSEPTLISEHSGVVVGFAKLKTFTVGGIKHGCILWIATHPAHRRRGIALALTISGVARLKEQGAGMVFASTQRRNRAALTNLSRAGFERVGFLGLWRLFVWRVFSFYRNIWYAPTEIVLMHR
jgi:ribosomal protein S18 acetylase RimI-like enzyme